MDNQKSAFLRYEYAIRSILGQLDIKGGQISHFSSIFKDRLWLELGRLFQ